MISKHFDESEATCKCGCGQCIINPALVGLLEAIRARFMQPVTVYSWNRCEDWNSQVGGVPNSFHVQGTACDISIENVPLGEIAEEAERVGADGIGIYLGLGFVHVDVRGWPARWTE